MQLEELAGSLVLAWLLQPYLYTHREGGEVQGVTGSDRDQKGISDVTVVAVQRWGGQSQAGSQAGGCCNCPGQKRHQDSTVRVPFPS